MGLVSAEEDLPGRISPARNPEHNCSSLSRSVVDRHDWILNWIVFRNLNSLWGPICNEDFQTASPIQLEARSPGRCLDGPQGLCSGPRSLIGRCIQKVKATIILVTPLWPSQPLFSALPPLCLDNQRILPAWENLMTPAQGVELPFPEPLPRLVAWLVSGDTTEPQQFQRAPQGSYFHCGDLPLTETTTLHGT